MKDQNLMVVITSPRGRWEANFPKTAKVIEVVEAVRQHFGFEPGAFLLRLERTGETLASERPLVSYGITDGESLLFVPEMGSGV